MRGLRKSSDRVEKMWYVAPQSFKIMHLKMNDLLKLIAFQINDHNKSISPTSNFVDCSFLNRQKSTGS